MRRAVSLFLNGMQPSRLAAVLAVWCLCLLYVLFQGGKTSLMLFSMVSLLTVYLIGAGFGGVNRVKAHRVVLGGTERGGEQLHAGEQVRVKLDVQVPGLLPMPYMIVREVLQRHNGDSWSFEDSVIPNLRGAGKLIFQTPPLERGRYAFSKTECISEDIFGLMEHKGRIEVETDFRVLPRTIYIPKWQRNIRNSRLGGTQTTVSASRRETTQINGVRDYVYGDRISRIHWNATAKTGSWKSKEFEHESFPRTMIVLDCAADGYDNAQQFELAVSAAASLIEYGAKEHAGTGLFTAAQEARMFAPADHAGERMRMIQHLVDVDYNRKGKLIATLEKSYRHFPKGALFLLISPMSGKEASEIMRWVETRGMNPCFLQITPSNETTKRDESISLLQSRGISSYSVASLDELPAALGGGA
ncbi:DUF58 domain-containing protein [Paenibacillus lautus]|jgi:uncharacterized protein (DUF58 family)|uniref:DUF58 domain-containing protein n=1 Tax=Paenibacillus lautus TaxID=1401 RepID=A0A385TTI2_PAELA|nr:DUF58 domain-containing protein [Paenibacillus lautus]AYB45647.1 DUF58 domain-containing protein [Paenibacillus lautus]MBY0158360.1 DUF58 domain-containing protein [Cytobacillus firmus]MCI1773778.1 DUF58 domain-containing protein [Paenibacillus lautus]